MSKKNYNKQNRKLKRDLKQGNYNKKIKNS